jgi:TetR/AcrR family transcriptional repressor of nem operon
MHGKTDSPARSARVFTAKGLATRARIVAAAADLVFEHGVAATSLEDVQNKAGVSGSQMYHYFSDKQELILAVVAHQAQGVRDLQAQLGPLDSLEALRAWADFHVDLQRQRHCIGGCELGSLVAQLAEADPQARSVLSASFISLERSLIDGLRAMHNRGELQPHADPEQLGTALLAAFEGGLLLAQSQRSVAPLRTALDTVIDYVRCLTPTSTTAAKTARKTR